MLKKQLTGKNKLADQLLFSMLPATFATFGGYDAAAGGIMVLYQIPKH